MKFCNVKRKNLLQTAELLEKTANKETRWRPRFHLSPKTGWLNDPNGLCMFNGEYHIFFQYSPFDVKPGTNFWGHYVTKDFISYKYLPPALCCDQVFDCHGVYSGSALIDEGKMYLYYTGNVKELGNFDYINNGRQHNLVLAVSDDGRGFDEKELLMKNSDYPADCTCHVRDPKVFKYEGKFYMALGARTKEDRGEVLVYESENKLDWRLLNRLRTDKPFGFMWECPDIYLLDGVWVLAVSPQGVEADGFKYNNVYQSGYFVLEGDFRSKDCRLGEFTELDRGFDFYAPQSFEDENGRRIMIGWLGLPDLEGYYENASNEFGWAHMLTIPRKLSLKGGKIFQQPLEEFEALRLRELSAEETKGIECFEFTAKCRNGENARLEIHPDCVIEFKEGVLSLVFGKCGCGRRERSVCLESLKELRVFCDSSCIEIYVNSGEEVFSSRFYPEKYNGITKAEGFDEIKIWELRGFSEVDDL